MKTLRETGHELEPKHPQKGAFANALRPGDRVTAFFLVRQKQLEPFRDRTKGEFLTLVLADRSGQVLARVWEGAPELAGTFDEGDIVKVAGDVEEYLGRTQLIVNRLRLAEEDEFDLADFLPATERDTGEMLAEVRAAGDRIENPHLAALVGLFYDDPEFTARLAQAPGSRRLHHSYLGGLLEHLTEVLALCESVLAQYPDLNADLLRAGALLHNVGKLREYSWARDIDYTDEGRLLGHVILLDEAIRDALAQLPDFPPQLALRLRHVLISHRGRYEWGAPRPPMTLEAIALHHVESLTTQVSRFRELLYSRREPDQAWTDYDRTLGRQLYAGPEDDESLAGNADATE